MLLHEFDTYIEREKQVASSRKFDDEFGFGARRSNLILFRASRIRCENKYEKEYMQTRNTTTWKPDFAVVRNPLKLHLFKRCFLDKQHHLNIFGHDHTAPGSP